MKLTQGRELIGKKLRSLAIIKTMDGVDAFVESIQDLFNDPELKDHDPTPCPDKPETCLERYEIPIYAVREKGTTYNGWIRVCVPEEYGEVAIEAENILKNLALNEIIIMNAEEIINHQGTNE